MCAKSRIARIVGFASGKGFCCAGGLSSTTFIECRPNDCSIARGIGLATFVKCRAFRTAVAGVRNGSFATGGSAKRSMRFRGLVSALSLKCKRRRGPSCDLIGKDVISCASSGVGITAMSGTKYVATVTRKLALVGIGAGSRNATMVLIGTRKLVPSCAGTVNCAGRRILTGCNSIRRAAKAVVICGARSGGLRFSVGHEANLIMRMALVCGRFSGSFAGTGLAGCLRGGCCGSTSMGAPPCICASVPAFSGSGTGVA